MTSYWMKHKRMICDYLRIPEHCKELCYKISKNSVFNAGSGEVVVEVLFSVGYIRKTPVWFEQSKHAITAQKADLRIAMLNDLASMTREASTWPNDQGTVKMCHHSSKSWPWHCYVEWSSINDQGSIDMTKWPGNEGMARTLLPAWRALSFNAPFNGFGYGTWIAGSVK